jgi:hypothetical protein
MTCNNEGQPEIRETSMNKIDTRLDLNKDGVVDKTDFTLAGKVLVKGKRK